MAETAYLLAISKQILAISKQIPALVVVGIGYPKPGQGTHRSLPTKLFMSTGDSGDIPV